MMKLPPRVHRWILRGFGLQPRTRYVHFVGAAILGVLIWLLWPPPVEPFLILGSLAMVALLLHLAAGCGWITHWYFRELRLVNTRHAYRGTLQPPSKAIYDSRDGMRLGLELVTLSRSGDPGAVLDHLQKFELGDVITALAGLARLFSISVSEEDWQKMAQHLLSSLDEVPE